MSMIRCAACGNEFKESAIRYDHNIPHCKGCYGTPEAKKLVQERLVSLHPQKLVREEIESTGYSALTSILFILAGLSLLIGLFVCWQAWPDMGATTESNDYALPVASAVGGIVQFAIFAALGQGLHYLKVIAEK